MMASAGGGHAGGVARRNRREKEASKAMACLLESQTFKS